MPWRVATRSLHHLPMILTVVGLLALGTSLLVYLVFTKPGPSGEHHTTPGRLVCVIDVEKGTHRIAVDSYGTSRSSEVWTAIAEVQGRAIEVAPRFEPGELLPKDLVIVRIDPTDYQLAITRLEAEVRATTEQLREFDQNEKNLQEIFRLQERQTKLAAAEYERQRQVFERSAVSRTALESAENAYVTTLTTLQQTRNSLALIPVQRDVTTASLEVAQARLAEARRDLERCEIRLPMPARCASKSVEDDQFVSVGERLGTFFSIETAEVVAKVETRKMLALFPSGIKELGKLDLTTENLSQSIFRRFRVPAEVHWGLGDRRVSWYGRLTRLGGSLDPATQTVLVVIEVPHPYRDVIPGVRPPLVPDVFCEVTIYGEMAADVAVIPRDAVHDGRVYLFRDGKLHIQPVEILVLEEDRAVISEGLETGDRVILTDLFPASEAMALRAETVPNPVKPRREVPLPKDLFADWETNTAHPTTGSPSSSPRSTTTPPAAVMDIRPPTTRDHTAEVQP